MTQKNLIKSLGLGIFLGLLSFLFLIPGPAGAEKPTVINLGMVIDASGPYGPSCGPYRAGALDALESIGGEVKGVKIEVIFRDTSNDRSKGLAYFNEVINMKPKPLFFYMSETPLAEVLKDRFVEEGILALEPGNVSTIYPVGNVFGAHPLYPEMLATLLGSIKDKWKEKRNPRVGIITWDTSYGRAFLTDEFFDHLKKIGVDIVGAPQLYGVRDVDISVQMMNLKAQNPDYLLTNNVAGGTLIIKKTAKEMGWDINLLNVWSDWGTVRLGPEFFEGDYAILHLKSFDEENDPSIKKVMEYFKKNNRTVKEYTLFYMWGFTDTLLIHHALETTVNRYGWQGLNVDNLKNVMVNINDFKPLDGLTTYSVSEKRRTPKMARVYRIFGGKLLPQTDFIEVPDLRPAEYR